LFPSADLVYYTLLYNVFLLLSSSAVHRNLHSFPTRRSSDLGTFGAGQTARRSVSGSTPRRTLRGATATRRAGPGIGCPSENHAQDRKSTRLNSSHVKISYAVFCLKKKKKRI